MPRCQADRSRDSCDWQDDGWQDGSSGSSGWQADGGSGMYTGAQTAEGWGVRPGAGPQASKQLDCRPQQQLACRPQQQLARQRAPPIPAEQPLTQNEFPEFLAGYKAGYDAAYLAGWEQGYHAGEIDALQMQEDEQDQGYQTNRRGASPDSCEVDEHGDCDDGDK